jgi:Holliday junction DNA helicase RuvA
MIGYLSGMVLASDEAKMILKTTTGIGYEVFYNRFSQTGEEKEIFITHIVRENSQTLFGFDSIEEKRIFELLLDVNGVGPKSAYSLVANLGVKALVNAICLDNKKALKQAPGVGPKAAAQIILSLKDKVQKLMLETPLQTNKVIVNDENKLLHDTLLACKELGFNEAMVLPKIQTLMESGEITKPEQMIKQLLQEFRI